MQTLFKDTCNKHPQNNALCECTENILKVSCESVIQVSLVKCRDPTRVPQAAYIRDRIRNADLLPRKRARPLFNDEWKFLLSFDINKKVPSPPPHMCARALESSRRCVVIKSALRREKSREMWEEKRTHSRGAFKPAFSFSVNGYGRRLMDPVRTKESEKMHNRRQSRWGPSLKSSSDPTSRFHASFSKIFLHPRISLINN